MMKTKSVFAVIATLLVVGIVIGAGCAFGAQKSITLRYSTMNPTDHISYSVAREIKSEVEKKTEGRIVINIFPAAQLGDWVQVYDELMMGSIDMAHSSVPETYDARMAVGYFPYLAKNYEELAKVFDPDSYVVKKMAEMQAKQGVYFCGFFAEGIAGIGTNKELTNPTSVTGDKGILIRTAAMDCYIQSLEYTGFRTTSIPFSDIFASMQTGLVDGYAGATPHVAFAALRDVTKYYYVYNMHPEVTQIMISQKSLDKLSEGDQKILTEVCRKACLSSIASSKTEDETYLTKLEESGVKVVRFTDEELDAFAEAVRKDVWAKLAETYTPEFIAELQKFFE